MLECGWYHCPIVSVCVCLTSWHVTQVVPKFGMRGVDVMSYS